MSVCVRRLITSPLLTDFIFRNATTAKHMKTAEALHNTHDASTTMKKTGQGTRHVGGGLGPPQAGIGSGVGMRRSDVV